MMKSFLVALLCVTMMVYANKHHPHSHSQTHHAHHTGKMSHSRHSGNDTVDLLAFHIKIQEVLLQTSKYEVLQAHHTVFDCAFPKSSILMTYSSHNTMELVHLQNLAFYATSDQLGECLSSKMVVLCLDRKCVSLCGIFQIPNCVFIGGNSSEHDQPQTPHFDHLSFLFLKYELMREALMLADQVFFFEADTLIFKNPFVPALYGGKEVATEKKSSEVIDILFQNANGQDSTTCNSGQPNAGQMLFQNSSQVHSFLSAMISLSSSSSSNSSSSDHHPQYQYSSDLHYLPNLLTQEKINYCLLPADRFVSILNTHSSTNETTTTTRTTTTTTTTTAVVKDLVSYHGEGIHGLEKKKLAMLKIVKHVRKNDTQTVREFLRVIRFIELSIGKWHLLLMLDSSVFFSFLHCSVNKM
jgi:hypothetical protein